MTTAMVIWTFVLSILTNILSGAILYNGDKARYEQNAFAKMLEAKLFKFFLKFNRKTTQIYLRTVIANILMLISLLIEIILFVLALASQNEGQKAIFCSIFFFLSLIICAVITAICRYKESKK